MGVRSRIAHPFPGKVRLVAFLHLSCWLVALASAGLFVAGLLEKNPLLLRATIGAIVLFTGMVLSALLLGHRLNCSVCANPIYSVKSCRKHGRARRFLGFSYRLGVAAEALIRSHFHCMYCGERIPLQKFERPREKGPAIADPLGNSHGDRLVLSSAVELPPRRD